MALCMATAYHGVLRTEDGIRGRAGGRQAPAEAMLDRDGALQAGTVRTTAPLLAAASREVGARPGRSGVGRPHGEGGPPIPHSASTGERERTDRHPIG